ncbi:hypothetical protein BDV95DRAFT_7789 [Massariosphaeria phaeospora]|uniref:Uncharacterized protein n=1 Tax=Massariosphaeria phaeospora TaxID=100035 RepID=A0A7C8IJJ4_9PLEO|nr:hypothetical protein BDV95DRAFT_7789 [Massariosphaeria phaeospora]
MSSFFHCALPVKSVLFAVLFASFADRVLALGDTDTITWGGDTSRAGYQPNHNLDPAVVAGADFIQTFKTLLPGNFGGLAAEQIFASPLVYTGSDGVQHVYVATTQNNVYKLDVKTGAIVGSRNLHVPFLTADLDACVDINPLIGITATGVIDPDTGIWYVTAKTYDEKFQDGRFSPQNPPGRLNARMWQHAIHTEDLSEAEGWPVLVDGTIFRNNPNRMFIGGNQHSRPAALLVEDYIYTGYASHCVLYNVTGAIIGFHKKTGKIVEAFATEGGPEPNTVKGGGIWMSGGGMAYDGRGSMFFSTGNGYASQLKPIGNAVPGRSPPTALEQAAVNAKINDDGTLTIIDFFMPWEKNQLDGADKDIGTTPLQILPSNVFSCPNHRRIGVVTGKSGKTYWLDLDNLGGYQMGPDNQDAVIQVFQNENSVYAGAGVLPLADGYIYISVTQFPTHVFRFSCSASGNALFTKVADTPDKNAYTLGTGHGTTTSVNGKEGSGLLWTSDVDGQGLRIYDPIPPSGGGPLTLLKSFRVPGVTKFSRPVFGDGRVYLGTTQGFIYGFGTSVNAPLNCSSGYSFGDVAIGSISSAHSITCSALTSTTIKSVRLDGNPNFNVSSVVALPLKLEVGQVVSFNVTATPQSVGSLSGEVLVAVTNANPGYSSSVSVMLNAVGKSAKPLLKLVPNALSFNVIANQSSPTQSVLFTNQGDTVLTFENVSFSLVSANGPWTAPTITPNNTEQVGPFLFSAPPTQIPPGTSVPFLAAYSPTTPGNHTLHITAFSNGGTNTLTLHGTSSTPPKCLIEFQSFSNPSLWLPYSPSTPFTFGQIPQSSTKNLLLRITNAGAPSTSALLPLTISKPPYGLPGLIGASNALDLAEGVSLAAGQSATANLYCAVPRAQVNTPGYNGTATWALNTGDEELGRVEVRFLCEAVSEQVGPLGEDGTARYGYVGCFKENNPGRQLAVSAYADARNNSNGRCVEACFGLGYRFAGTQ